MSKSITIKKAKEALQNLRKLAPANPKIDDDLEISIKEAVTFMAPDLIRMTKRGFTLKELADGLAGEGVEVKPGTLNRYLNEYLDAKREAEKSKASLETGPAETAGEGTGEEKPGPENPKPGGQKADEKSDPPPEDQPPPSSATDRE